VRPLFEGCQEGGPTTRRDLDWDVDVPDGTTVVFLVRPADSVEELDSAEWFTARWSGPERRQVHRGRGAAGPHRGGQ